MRKVLTGAALILAAVVGLWSFFAYRLNHEPAAARPIGPLAGEPIFWDAAFEPSPIAGVAPAHPFLAPAGRSTMHGDGYQSDVHEAFGPVGADLEVRTRRAGGKMPRSCPTFVFLKDGTPVTLCAGLFGFYLNVIDPETLERRAIYSLPMRPSAFQTILKRDYAIMFSDSSGGAYLFLDDKDRIVLIDSRQILRRIAVEKSGDGGYRFRDDAEWSLRDLIPHDCLHYDNWFPRGECDMATTVMPDHQGRYWWVTRYGRVGVLDPETGKSAATRLEGEEVQNAFAVDERAVYVLTDHAQYAFHADARGEPEILWREAYDRGSSRKVGSINQGSGTTPTLIGDRYITFADNADSRINIIVARRGAPGSGETRRLCTVPVFREGASATDNSMIGWGRSILLENNSGYTNGAIQKDWNAFAGGVVRVDIRDDETGCDVVWESDLVVPSVVAKLSTENGIAYYYTFDRTPEGGQRWALVGLDFSTGRQVLKVPIGVGNGFNNNWSSIAIAPNGDLYIGVMHGLVQVRSRAP